MHYANTDLTREEVDQLQGPTVLEFGANWCGICRGAQPVIAAAMAMHPDVRHLKIEDGKGRRLGRSFRVKLWPTLIFMKDGEEVTRLARPTAPEPIAKALDEIQGS